MKRHVLDRFAELARFLIDVGCCRSCAKTFSSAAVKQERGSRPWVKPIPCVGNKTTRQCRDMAIDAWSTRPGAHGVR